MSSLEAGPEVSKDSMLFSVCSLGCLQLEMGAISSHSTACPLPAVSVLMWTLVSLELYTSNKSSLL